ncbi:MAG: 16S rRNA methyltransferase [Spirochaetaceae bacterium]|nr:16S rRNA methyltransferase [Spirochaetaceae bacterium]
MPAHNKPAGNTAFETFYRAIWGGRWDSLKAALKTPPCRIAYTHNLSNPYLLDAASVQAACELALPETAQTVLDMCAAPGGKSLVIASRMPANCVLVANELSSERRRRLARVLDGHLPPPLRSRVKVSGFDAAALAGKKSEHNRFDGILLDAPCSSERHVFTSEKHLAAWTPARPVSLARRQWALLSAAFLLLKPGGLLVYATCAINPAENEGVIRRLFEKYGNAVCAEPPVCAGENSAAGTIILPDTCNGAGPMFIAKARKQHG